MKRILRLVVSGGPCAGKTEGTEMLKEYLSKKGYRALLIPEVATYLMKSGIVPYDNCVNKLKFQEIIFEEQLFQENLFYRVAEELDNDSQIVIIQDRSLMDNKMYLSDGEFADIIAKYNLSENDIMKRYDLVIHMISTSSQEAEFYDKGSNEYRMEDAEEAKKLEEKCSSVWKNHPNVLTVGIADTFIQKLENLKDVVREYLNF